MMNVFPTAEIPSIRKNVQGSPVLPNMLATKEFSHLLGQHFIQLVTGRENPQTEQGVSSEDQIANVMKMLEEGTLTWEHLMENLEIIETENGEQFLFRGTVLSVSELQALFTYATEQRELIEGIPESQSDKLEEILVAIDKNTAERQPIEDFTQNPQWLHWFQDIKSLMEKVVSGDGSFKDRKQILHLLKEWSSNDRGFFRYFMENNTMDAKQNKLWLQLVENFQRRESLPAQYQKPITHGDIEKWIRHAMQNLDLTGTTVERADITTALHQTAQPKLAQYVVYLQQSDGDSLERQLVHEFRHILNDSKFLTLQNGMNQLSIRLKPEHLGDVVVRLTEVNGEMTVRMIVQSQAAKDLLDKNMHQLKHLFSPHQVTIEKQDNMFTSHATKFQEESNGEQPEDQQQQEQLNRDSDTKEEESLTFEEVLMDQKV